MPKGYWIGHIEVHNPERYKDYIAGATPAYQEHGAKFLIRGGAFENREGDDIGSRHVVIEFKDLETAKACYESATYQKAREHRIAAASGHLMIVEGAE
jgi:uncharacterized protein (DUF1330 family)